MSDVARREPGTSPEAIRFHYDVSDEFYRLWLDERLIYSCAVWQDAETDIDLERAQLRKLDALLEWANVTKGSRILEVGCGWGALLERAVTKYGVTHATGISLSEGHAAYTRARKLPRTEIRVESYLEHEPDAPYDALFCVEVMEHFASPAVIGQARIDAYRAFFARCRRWLTPGGIISLQVCAYGALPRGACAPFILDDVFPDSDMPRLSEIAAAADGLFEVTRLVDDRLQYEKTIGVWLRRLLRNRARAVELVGEHRVKRYMQFLQHSRFGFATGALALYRIRFRRVDDAAMGPRPVPCA